VGQGMGEGTKGVTGEKTATLTPFRPFPPLVPSSFVVLSSTFFNFSSSVSASLLFQSFSWAVELPSSALHSSFLLRPPLPGRPASLSA
jgi:hypothetical protein